jgi:hypothetical protein
VFRDGVTDIHLQRLGLAPAVHILSASVPGKDVSLEIEQRHRIVCVADDGR